MANIQVTFDSDVNNARSESSLVVNPNNPMQIVSASKKFNNIQTYDFTLATAYSTDGGQSWHDSAAFALPSGATVMTDPTMAWDDSGNVFMVGLAGKNPPTWDVVGIVIYKSTNGGKTWSAPKMIHQSAGDDKQWAAGDSNPASPHHGNVYAVWDDPAGTIDFARTKDHGANWVGAGTGATPPIGATINDGCYYPEINVAADGTVYVAAIAGRHVLRRRTRRPELRRWEPRCPTSTAFRSSPAATFGCSPTRRLARSAARSSSPGRIIARGCRGSTSRAQPTGVTRGPLGPKVSRF